ncbi:MAG: outer membrane lipoprotein carrier protein LolA [Bacilli bacterium]|nr:outer membrane lipoprotein carrier protein LolA [Bacilli bacterium]
MKKIIFLLVISLFVLTGCGKYSNDSIINELEKKVNSGYKLSGSLNVINNDENYDYNIDVYNKGDNYKVILTNKANDHTQVILKNKEGVYVLTPSLNKSFKFQSDWPYNNSQIYLLKALINDIKEDKDTVFKKSNNSYIFKSKVKYINNTKLDYQKVVLGNDLDFEKVIVYDNDGVEAMTMNFDSISYSYKFKNDEFDLDTIVGNSEEEVSESSSLDDIIYPLYIPNGTKLVNEDKIDKENGKRVIMDYDGEKSFLLVEETSDIYPDFTVIPTLGEPCFLMDTLGVATSNSLSWTSGGVDYYLVSDVLSQSEMVEVAQSISGIVSMK